MKTPRTNGSIGRTTLIALGLAAAIAAQPALARGDNDCGDRGDAVKGPKVKVIGLQPPRFPVGPVASSRDTLPQQASRRVGFPILRPHRRRAQRQRPPHGYDGDRIGAGGVHRTRGRGRGCGRPDETTGEAICAFVVLKRSRSTGDEAKKVATELRNWVAKEIGPIAKPKEIRFGDNLPKTRSGNIMRQPAALDRQGRSDHAGHQYLGEPAILDQLAERN